MAAPGRVSGYTVKVLGGPEIDAALKKLKAGIVNRVARKAIEKGARPVVRALKAAAPKDSGLLKKRLGHRVAMYPRTGSAVAVLGVKKLPSVDAIIKRKPRGGTVVKKKGKGRPAKFLKVQRRTNPTFYLHLAERGRKEVRPKQKKALAAWVSPEGTSEGIIGARARAFKGHHFMKRTWTGMEQQTYRVIAGAIEEGLKREVAKAAAKGK